MRIKKNIFTYSFNVDNRNGYITKFGIRNVESYYEGNSVYEFINRTQKLLNKHVHWDKKKKGRIVIYGHNSHLNFHHSIIQAFRLIPEFHYQLPSLNKVERIIVKSKVRENYKEVKNKFPYFTAVIGANDNIIGLDLFLRKGQCIQFRSLSLATTKFNVASKDIKNITAELFDYIKAVPIKIDYLPMTISSLARRFHIKSLMPFFLIKFNGRIKALNPYQFIIDGDKSKKYSPLKLCNFFYKEMFPATSFENHRLFSKALKSGLTTANPANLGKLVSNVNYIDRNGAYMSVANSKKLFPYGLGIDGNGGKEYPLKLYKVEFVKHGFQNKTLPFLFIDDWLKSDKDTENAQWENGKYLKLRSFQKKRNDYYFNIPAGSTFYLTSPEYEMVIKYYGKEVIKSDVIYSWKGVVGNEIFKHYVNYWKEIKEQSDNKFKRSFAKKMLNARYGKEITKIIQTFKLFNLKDGTFEVEKVEKKPEYYFPISLFINAYARAEMVNSQINSKNFVYADTDSIAFKNDIQPNLPLDNKKMGYYKNVYSNADANSIKVLAINSKAIWTEWLEQGKLRYKVILAGYKFYESEVFELYTNKKLSIWKNGKYTSGDKYFMRHHFVSGNFYLISKYRKLTPYGAKIIKVAVSGTPIWSQGHKSAEIWFNQGIVPQKERLWKYYTEIEMMNFENVAYRRL